MTGEVVTSGSLAFAFSLACIFSPLSMIVSGSFADRYGPRYILMIAGLFIALGFIGSALCTSAIGIIICYGFFVGCGLGTAFNTGMGNVLKFFPDRIGVAGGLASTCFGASSVIVPFIAVMLLAYFDIAQTFIILGSSFGLIIIISAYDWGAIEEKARAIGVNGFIAKPFFASSLYNTLTSLTRRTAPKRETEVSAPPESEAETAHQHYDFTGKHILLVEDNEFNREVAQEFLEMTGATVESAENGSEGVALFTASETGQYDIILMDVQMPVMDGYEATRTIRASVHPDANSIPILAMTANAFSEDVAAAVAAGMNGHIAKPIDVTALYRLLASHFK